MTGFRRFSIARLGAVFVVPLICLACRTAVASAQIPATISGRVMVMNADVPLGFAVVGTSVPSQDQFADGDGRFTLRDVRPGRVTLTVRRVGYAPFDTTFSVASGETVRLVLQMSLVTITLPAVHSLAKACVHPGASSAVVGLELAKLLEQVGQNADRNQLLSRSYPFELTVERRITRPEPALEARFVAYDTVRVPSERPWRYAPGRMLGARDVDGGIFGGHWMTLVMPQLSDFADESFLQNHCFDYGGLEMVGGDSLLRIEFLPAPSVRAVDVSGTIFLDPTTFQLRQTLILLANPNKQLRELIETQTVRATFIEVVPGVPVLNQVASIVYPKINPKEAPPEPSTETQRTLGVKFLKRDPRKP